MKKGEQLWILSQHINIAPQTTFNIGKFGIVGRSLAVVLLDNLCGEAKQKTDNNKQYYSELKLCFLLIL